MSPLSLVPFHPRWRQQNQRNAEGFLESVSNTWLRSRSTSLIVETRHCSDIHLAKPFNPKTIIYHTASIIANSLIYWSSYSNINSEELDKYHWNKIFLRFCFSFLNSNVSFSYARRFDIQLKAKIKYVIDKINIPQGKQLFCTWSKKKPYTYFFYILTAECKV